MNIPFWESGHIPADIVDVDLWENDACLLVYNKRIYFQFDGNNPNMEDAINFIIAELDVLSELRSKIPEVSTYEIRRN